MGLIDIIRSGVATASNVTADIQALVVHSPWIGDLGGSASGKGKAAYGAPIPRRAFVNTGAQELKMKDGQSVLIKAKIVFLDPIPPNGAAGRREPIDVQDKIVLPDGTTGPIIDTGGLLDAGTTAPFVNTVFLGAS